MTDPDEDTGLHLGETLLAEWRPAFGVFLRKLLVVGALTALLLGAAGMSMSQNVWLWIASFPLAMAAYIFVFDDYDEWPRRRHDRWLLTDRRLVYRHGRDAGQNRAVELTEIARIRPWMSWALRVRLRNRQTLLLSYLPEIGTVRAALDTAVAQAGGGADDIA